MDYNDARACLLEKPAAREDFPFGPEVAVFKVKNKMFATLAWRDGMAEMNLKCDPQEAFALRDMFESVIPGYHMNKKHWNTVILDGSVPENEIRRMIDGSFVLVVKGMTRAERLPLEVEFSPEVLYFRRASLLEAD